MKKHDWGLLAVLLAVIVPLATWDEALQAYLAFNRAHGMITSFIKFGILATLGEVIALRIRTGGYFRKGFGILPRIVVWGLLGLTIKAAFVIFAAGTPRFLGYLGFADPVSAMNGGITGTKILVAFAISIAMNGIYAPVMMTFHKVTDTHIVHHGGGLGSLAKPIDFAGILKSIDWDVHWNFVLKKTIPLFWIPAHTVTFLLPPDFRVLFAALLSVFLGLILAVASLKSAGKSRPS